MLHVMYLWLPLAINLVIMLVLSRMNVEETNAKIKASFLHLLRYNNRIGGDENE